MSALLPILIVISVIILSLPVQGQPVDTGISPAAANLSGMPSTQNVSVYISDAKARLAERDWNDALNITARGLALYPDNAGLLCVQGYTYRKIGQYRNAVDDVSRSIIIDPEPVRYANRGYAYLALRNYSAALADAKAGLSLNASYIMNYGVEALALQGMGHTTRAISSIDTALALSPGNAHFWHVKGILLAARGDCTEAAAAFRKSLAIDPDYDLPYPGFPDASESLASLNTTCTPTFQVMPSQSPDSFAEYLMAASQ